MKIDRLLGIVIQLLNHERVSARELAGKFEVSIRTIQRDIEALSKAGIPVVSSQGSSGGYGIMEGYKLDNQIMDTDDYYFIVTALKGLCSAYGNSRAEQALDKMRSVLPGAGERIPGPTGRHMVIDFGAFRESGHVSEHIPVIEAAVDGARVLEFDYTNSQHECTHRLVEPVAAVLKWHAWYLLAYCQMRCDYRLFRIGRIRNIRITERFFSMKHPIADEIIREMEEENGRAYIRLKLRCRPEIRVSIEDYFPKGMFQMSSDGTFAMETHVPEDEPFWLGALLSYGDKVEVLEPDSLRRSILEKARALEALYRDRIRGGGG